MGKGCPGAVVKPNSKNILEQASTPNIQNVSIPIQSIYLPPRQQEPKEIVVNSNTSSHTYKCREPIPLHHERVMTEENFIENAHVVKENNLSGGTCLLLHTFRNSELPIVVAQEDDYFYHHEGVQWTRLNYFFDLAENEEIMCMSLNEDSSLQLRINREVLLIPHHLTKVQLYCRTFEDFNGKESILLNDKLYKEEVVMGNSLIRFEGNTYHVFISNKTDKRIVMQAGDVFCEGVILENDTLILTEKAFVCMSFTDRLH